jgi:hypothetical protein
MAGCDQPTVIAALRHPAPPDEPLGNTSSTGCASGSNGPICGSKLARGMLARFLYWRGLRASVQDPAQRHKEEQCSP